MIVHNKQTAYKRIHRTQQTQNVWQTLTQQSKSDCTYEHREKQTKQKTL